MFYSGQPGIYYVSRGTSANFVPQQGYTSHVPPPAPMPQQYNCGNATWTSTAPIPPLAGIQSFKDDVIR